MDSVGHLKIADFGLALENIRGRKKAKEHAGTLGYIAPELLLKEPAMRLGRKGLIRSHSFFQSIDWEELEAGRVEPPFTLSTPSMDEVKSVVMQEKALSSAEPLKTPVGPENQKLFCGFSFISPQFKISSQSTAATPL
ncbi:kinase C theta type isoform X2 [Pelobates cultripes]|uniref:Kinase C theta type isoform X2 n=1 Tax=Pelobates cultripes TaxID=61616 RepID=A0AAD1TP63_PELCU|nr:kinase C theta type isoform X2 [Pelobates cultripes]